MFGALTRWAAGAMLIVLLAFYWIPFGKSIFSLTQAFDHRDLTPAFLRLVLRSIFYTTLHALAASALVALVAMLVAPVLAATPRRPWALRVYSFLGLMAFSMPGVVVAGIYLQLAEGSEALPRSGILALMLCHFAINAGFVSCAVAQKLRCFLALQGGALFEAASSLGISSRGQGRLVLAPVVIAELRVWAPLVFVWSFFSFAPVLMLAGSPAQSSPEVLLFQSLTQTDSSARVILLIGVYLLCSFVLFWIFRSRSSFAQGSALDSEAFLEQTWFPLRTLLVRLRACFDGMMMLGFLAGGAWIISWLRGFPVHRAAEFFDALKVSVCLCLGNVALTSVLFFGFVLSPQWLRHTFFFFSLMGSGFLIATWAKGGWGDLSAFGGAGLVFVSMGVSLTVLNVASVWIEERFRHVSLAQVEMARSLGLSPWASFRYAYWPSLQDVFASTLSLAALWGLGDVAFSELFLERDSLTLLVRRQAARYDFDGVSFVLFLLVGMSLLVVAIRRLFERGLYVSR